MSAPLLGCPHCGKPVGFAQAMAGKVVACPHCRGQFQMPERPPVSVPPPPNLGRMFSSPGAAEISFENLGSSADTPTSGEPSSYQSAITLANLVVIGPPVAMTIGGGLAIFAAARGIADVPIWLLLLASLFLAALVIAPVITGLLLVRACVFVLVDVARTLRAIERDSIVNRKMN